MSSQTERNEEARKILFSIGLGDKIEELEGANASFVERMVEKLEDEDVAGKPVWVSDAQLRWLRDLKDRLVERGVL